MRRKIKKIQDVPNVRNASGRAVPIVGTIKLVVQIGTSTHMLNVLIAENFGTSVIVGCDFCDVHVESIKPRLTIVERDERSTVRTIQQTSKPNTTVPLPEEQNFDTRRKRSSAQIKTTKRLRLKPATQT